jgi:hypothetical protein
VIRAAAPLTLVLVALSGCVPQPPEPPATGDYVLLTVDGSSTDPGAITGCVKDAVSQQFVLSTEAGLHHAVSYGPGWLADLPEGALAWGDLVLGADAEGTRVETDVDTTGQLTGVLTGDGRDHRVALEFRCAPIYRELDAG